MYRTRKRESTRTDGRRRAYCARRTRTAGRAARRLEKQKRGSPPSAPLNTSDGRPTTAVGSRTTCIAHARRYSIILLLCVRRRHRRRHRRRRRQRAIIVVIIVTELRR